MKKASIFTFQLSFWVIVIFGSAMMLTFISDYLSVCGFFGDSKYTTHYGEIREVWGVRHYWYSAMVTILFFVSIIRVVVWAAAFWSDNDGEG